MKKKKKTLILCISIFVVAVAAALGLWFLLRNARPAGNGNVLNVAWYHENGTEFIITTADELYEVAELSEYYDFEGQTIKLGADIVVNEGNAADWGKKLPEKRWESIRNFAGTFDGQGHSISGLYGSGELYGLKGIKKIFYTTGLFAETNAKCTIKNFKLLNSYFCSDLNEGVGSISSSGGGTFENIYSDAIVVSYKSNNGGIIGLFNQKGSITNCWFDGELRVEGTVGRFTGGIAGRVCASNGQSKIEHCLNTANISSTVVNRGMNTGGLIGNIQSQARINITDCLTVGDISVNYEAGVGSFIGNIESSSAVIIKNSYVKTESFTEVIYNANGSLTGAAAAYNEATLTGYNAYKWSELDFENYWAVVEDGTPVLKTFADKVPSLEGIKKAYDTSWYKLTDSEFLIKTPEQLYGLAILSYSDNFIGKGIYLGNDIVLNEGNAEDWAEKAPENRWIPIGTYGYPFEGFFDGAGNTISGLYLKAAGGFGMFGAMSSSSMISNVKLENSYLEASGQTIGSIVGLGAGTIQYVYSNAIVVGNKGNVGGIAGQAAKNSGLQMSNCWFDGKATNLGNKSDTKKIGGLIGTVRSESFMTNCLNTGTIDASIFDYNQSKDPENPTVVPIIGGLVGYVEKEIPFGMKDCLNVGQVLYNEAATAAYGSVVGYIDGNVTAYNVYAAEDSCTNHPLKQSVSGQVCPIDKEELTGIKAYQWTLLDFEKEWAVVENGTPVLKAFATNAPSVEGIKKEVDVSWYSVDKETFVLDSREDLLGFRLMTYNTDFADRTVKLGKDITLNTGNAASWAKNTPKYEWTPIGSTKYSFKGTFDGAMHTISGLYIKVDTEYAGFFSVLTEGTTVKNLKIKNSYYETSADYMGSIAGSGNANLSNLYSNAILVSSANSVAGFVGRSTKDITITDCWFDGTATITGTGMPNRRAGGIVACIYSGKVNLSHCLNSGTVAAPNYTGTNSATSTAVVPLIGGLVGQVSRDAEVTIDDSLNTGKVTCNPAATTGYSAIVGYSDGIVELKNTFATSESCEYQIRGKYAGSVTTYEASYISGYAGYEWTTLDFNKHWAVVISPKASTPVLKSFASSVPSIAGVEKLIDVSWYDESKTEYVLKDKADLNGFAYLSNSTNFAGKTVKLGADIVMNKDMANPTLKWDPIGSKQRPFAGNFDGGMHTISGLYVNTDVECSGLFAATAKEATVKNLILADSYFESTADNIGSIAGIGRGTFDTIKSEATVVANAARVGGIIGMNSAKGTKLTNCWFAGTVTNKGNGEGLRGTGGLVGVAYDESDITIINCLNTGTVDAVAYEYNQKTATNPQIVVLAGGLVGWVRSSATLTIGGALNVGEVKVSSKSADDANGFMGYGSVVGYVDGTVVNTAKFYTTAESNQYQMNNGKAGLVVVNKNDIVGLKGYQWNTLDLDFVKAWTLVEGGTPVLQAFASKVIDVSKVEKLIDDSWYDADAIEYVLYDKADLYGFALLSQKNNFAGKIIKLGADIVVNEGDAANWGTTAPELAWTPIGKSTVFKGVFDGQMYTISGLYVKESTANAGMFGKVDGATIKNFKLMNSYIIGSSTDVGSIAGAATKSTMENIYSNAIVVSSDKRVGGLVGQMTGVSSIQKTWFDGTVETTRTGTDVVIGGLIGLVQSAGTQCQIINCLNSGTVSAVNTTDKTPEMGGLVGGKYTNNSNSTIVVKNCLNTGTVIGASGVTGDFGPFIGYNANGTFEKVYATAESCANVITTPSGTTTVALADIIGLKGYQWSKLDLDFANTWTFVVDDESTTDVNEESTPILQVFADEIVDVTTVDKLFSTDWYDENATEYVLKDKADLYGFASLSQTNNFAGKTIKLGADIVVNEGDAADWATEAPEYTWTPIGEFAGTFDGDMHTISGIYVNIATTNAGFFSKTTATAQVREFKLVNSYIKNEVSTAASYIGSIAGSALGTFDTIYSNAIVDTNKQRVGGLIGYVSSDSTGTVKFSMSNCWFDGIATSTRADDIRIGGLIGQSQATATMTNCLNTGTIQAPNANTADPEIAGLVGCVSTTLTMNNCVSVGALERGTSSKNYGAIVGYNSNKVTGANNYYSTGSGQAGPNISDAIATGLAADKLSGDAAKDNMNLDFANTWVAVTGNAPVLKSFASVAFDTSWYTGNSSEYVLYDKADLLGFAALSQTNNFEGITIKLGADIELNQGNAANWGATAPAYIWTPAGEFAGTFDGDMHTISGIYVNIATTNAGFFSRTTATAQVREIKLVNSYIKNEVSTAASYIGSIAGSALGTFDAIYSNAIVVTNKQRVGGFIGYVSSDSTGTVKFKMTNCWFDGTVSSTRADDIRIGGLIGQSQATATVTNCLFTGTVKTPSANTADTEAAGFVGCVSTTLTMNNCVSLGTLEVGSSTGNYGAFAGYNKSKVTGTNNYYSASWSQAGPNVGSTIANQLTIGEMTGESAKDNMNLDFADTWKTVEGSTPILKAFAPKTEIISLAANAMKLANALTTFAQEQLF